jgi:hypothetical protein
MPPKKKIKTSNTVQATHFMEVGISTKEKKRIALGF